MEKEQNLRNSSSIAERGGLVAEKIDPRQITQSHQSLNNSINKQHKAIVSLAYKNNINSSKFRALNLKMDAYDPATGKTISGDQVSAGGSVIGLKESQELIERLKAETEKVNINMKKKKKDSKEQKTKKSEKIFARQN